MKKFYMEPSMEFDLFDDNDILTESSDPTVEDKSAENVAATALTAQGITKQIAITF